MSYPKPDKWGGWFPHAGTGIPERAIGEWVWFKTKDGYSDIRMSSMLYWNNADIFDEERIVAYRLRDNHPAYLKHSNTDPHNVPAELEANPLFGQF